MESILTAGRDRPATARLPAAPRRQRRPRSLRTALIVANLLALTAAIVLWRLAPGVAAAPPSVAVPVSRGDVDTTIDSSGKAQAQRTATLAFPAAGQVQEVLVHPGDVVKQGQPIARLTDHTLHLAVEKAQADLQAAQANLQKLQAGPTAAQLAGANAAVAAAQASLAKVQAGPSAQDLADAQADWQAAQAHLAGVKAGATSDQIANAEADVRSADAALAKVKAGPTTQEIADAQANLAAAQAKVDQLAAQPGPDSIAAARGNLAAAQAKLSALQSGPTAAQLSAAQMRVSNAQDSLNKTSSAASAAKRQAEIALDQAANAVRDAQDKLNEASMIGVPRKGPEHILNPDGTFNADATQGQIDAYNAALRAEQDASGNMQKAQLALDDARKQEIADVGSAQATLDDARKQLADLQAGPTAADLTAAQAAVSSAQSSLTTLLAPVSADTRASAQAALVQARNTLATLQAGPSAADLAAALAAADKAHQNLSKLQAGPSAADLAAAQATLDKARNTLAALKAGPTAADLAAAQASADKAHDALTRLQAGPSAADVAAAQATLAQAQATLAALHATPADLAGAQASVVQAQTALDTAQAALDAATLTAPFAGTIATASADAGSQVGSSTAVATLVDTTTLHVDVDLSESDVARVASGQSVTLTFDALPGQVLTGTVSAVAPVASSSQNVVTYLVTVGFSPGKVPVKVGMSADASILVDRRQGVLRAPSRAIQTTGPLKSVQVLYGQAQTPVTVHVQTGASNGTWTEITGCLETGNQCLHDGDQLALTLPGAPSNTASGPGGFNQVVVNDGPGGAAPGGTFFISKPGVGGK